MSTQSTPPSLTSDSNGGLGVGKSNLKTFMITLAINTFFTLMIV